MDLNNLFVDKIIGANLWYITCPKCRYKNSKDNLVQVCPICGIDLKIGTFEEIELLEL